MIRRSNRSITVDAFVDIEVCEVLEEVSDEEIINEVERRKLGGRSVQLLGCEGAEAARAIEPLRAGRAREALTLLERALFPKFKTIGDCQQAYLRLTGTPLL